MKKIFLSILFFFPKEKVFAIETEKEGFFSAFSQWKDVLNNLENEVILSFLKNVFVGATIPIIFFCIFILFFILITKIWLKNIKEWISNPKNTEMFTKVLQDGIKIEITPIPESVRRGEEKMKALIKKKLGIWVFVIFLHFFSPENINTIVFLVVMGIGFWLYKDLQRKIEEDPELKTYQEYRKSHPESFSQKDLVSVISNIVSQNKETESGQNIEKK